MKYVFCLLISTLVLQTFTLKTKTAATNTIKTTAASSDSDSNSNVSSQQKEEKASLTHSVNYEAHASQMLNAASERMQIIWNRKREMFLNITKDQPYKSISQETEIDNEYRHLVYELALNLSVIPVKQLQSPILCRQVKRLSKLQFFGLNNMEYAQIKHILDKMQGFIKGKTVCHHKIEDCSKTEPMLTMLPMLPNITTIMMHTKSSDVLISYWIKWRDAVNENNLAKSTFLEYLRLMRIAANYNGHVTPSRTWYLYYETPQFQNELEDVVWEIMPLYQELHAYLRNSVRSTYGTRLTADDGAIPAHVMEQIIMQAWYPHTCFRSPYPDSQLPTVKNRLHHVLLSPMKVNQRAAEFFESLGLQNMSDEFYEKFSRRISDKEMNSDCRSEVLYFPPDVALRYCPTLTYKKLLQMHGNMADLQYNLYKKELPFGLDREPCPGFGSGISESVIIASGTPRHLSRLHILYNESLPEKQTMNRLFRMGVHTILAIPQYFVNEKFLVDTLDGRIGPREYNCGYWRLQYKYAGVVPPTIRNEDTLDADYKFYKGLNPENSNTAKLLSEILGYQFYQAFCLASGQYQPGSAKFPLHNCDFYSSTTAGTLMKNMMKLGATKNWRDVLEIATGERKLSGKGVMEYFAPLFTWLKNENKELDLEPGWDASIRCGRE